VYNRLALWGRRSWNAIEPLLEDRFDAWVVVSLDLKRAQRGRLEALGANALLKPDYAQARTIALIGIGRLSMIRSTSRRSIGPIRVASLRIFVGVHSP